MTTAHAITFLLNRQMDWPGYYEALQEADVIWEIWYEGQDRTCGVFKGDATYLATIEAGGRLVRSDWSKLTPQDAPLLLGLVDKDGHDNGLLGSMKGAGRARHFFKAGTPEQLSEMGEMLSPVISAPPNDMARAAQEAAEGITRYQGISMGVATRILTLARPDSLVSINGNSKRKLALLTGIPDNRLQCPVGYAELVDWTMEQPWWNSRQPADPQERAAWKARAALLDCFAYEEL